MQFHQITLTLGISSLYLGFSVALGLMLHDHRRAPGTKPYLPALAFVVLIFIPASAMVLCFPAWSPILRLAVAGTGWLGSALAAIQPAWIPPRIWGRHVQRGYLALAMATVAVWGLSTWALFSSGAAMLIGLAALTAGSSSARTMLAA
ncbi:MAG: hypothetical protein ACK2T2_09755 [Anaerolineales bacterium]|jgi:hypothetical protein